MPSTNELAWYDQGPTPSERVENHIIRLADQINLCLMYRESDWVMGMPERLHREVVLAASIVTLERYTRLYVFMLQQQGVDLTGRVNCLGCGREIRVEKLAYHPRACWCEEEGG